MKHHYIDFLDRKGNFWKITPNIERNKYTLNNISENDGDVRIISISRDDKNWNRLFSLNNLEELNLHNPSEEQLLAITNLQSIKRLRINCAQTKNIDFIKNLPLLEELVLEYVSGFSDLSHLKTLIKLKSLHIENLRSVENFDAIGALKNLIYLSIYGTPDKKQNVGDFTFIGKLQNLKVLRLFLVSTRVQFPALISISNIKNLVELYIPRTDFQIEEYALLEVALPNTQGAKWEPYIRKADSRIPYPREEILAFLPESVITELNNQEIYLSADGQKWINDPKTEWFEFLGKGSGRVKCTTKASESRCEEFKSKYQQLKNDAKAIIKNRHLTLQSTGTVQS